MTEETISPEEAPVSEESEQNVVTFASMDLPEPLLQALDDAGYETPTPVQAACIPALLTGGDVIGQAQTGSGKTAAFALPILAQVDLNRRTPQALVLAPTRELAQQVADACRSYGAHLGRELTVASLCGGQSYETQLRALRRGSHVVVGTPGRVMDHIRKETLDLSALQLLVLDEADEMLKMGFIEDVQWILSQTPETRQMALFSATMPPEIRRIAEGEMQNPTHLSIEKKQRIADTISQAYVLVYPPQKQRALIRLLEGIDRDGTMVFVRTKMEAVALSEGLQKAGFSACALQGDMPQRERDRAVERFKGGDVDIVVATDVAARGLDVDRVNLVVNYEAPNDLDSYVHRVGRTGRAGRGGQAILLLTPRESRVLKMLERVSGRPLETMALPSAEQVNERRMAIFADEAQRVYEKGGGKEGRMGRRALDMLMERCPDASIEEIAASCVRIALGDTPPATDMQLPSPDSVGGKGKKGEPRQRASRRQDGTEPGMRRYSIGIGKVHNIRAGQLVGALTHEGGLKGSQIGRIDMKMQFCVVDIAEEVSSAQISRLAKLEVAGRYLNIRSWSDAPPEKDASEDRSGRQDRFIGKELKGSKASKFSGKPSSKSSEKSGGKSRSNKPSKFSAKQFGSKPGGKSANKGSWPKKNKKS